MKWICMVCGYIYEGTEPPAICPVCKAPKDKFEKLEDSPDWADVHRIGIARDLDPRVIDGLREHYRIECHEVGAYMAMARRADVEGYPEIANTFQRMAREEAAHAARLAELLGEALTDSTEKNCEARVAAELAASKDKQALAILAKDLGYDIIHAALPDMCKDAARHGNALEGILKRYFLK